MIPTMKPGTFVQVTDYLKNHTYPPKTLGVLSSLSPRAKLVWSISLVIIRRGKKGIKRLDRIILSLPIHKTDCVSIKDEYKRFGEGIIHVKPVLMRPRNLIDIDDMEFLAWINAYTWHLQHLDDLSPGGQWYGLQSENIIDAYNSNLGFNSKIPQRSYYNFDEKASLLEEIRKEEIRMIDSSHHYYLNICNKAIDGFVGSGLSSDCSVEEKKSINGKIKYLIKKTHALKSAIRGT